MTARFLRWSIIEAWAPYSRTRSCRSTASSPTTMTRSGRCSTGTSTATPRSCAGGPFKVSSASVGYVRSMWERIGTTVMGRRLFDQTNGWEGKPPAGEHIVVVSHRPKPPGWHPEASCVFAGDVAAAIAAAKELAGDRDVAVTAGDIGGQALRARPGRRGRDGRRAGRVRLRPALLRISRRAAPARRCPTSSSRATGCCTCATGPAADSPPAELGRDVRQHRLEDVRAVVDTELVRDRSAAACRRRRSPRPRPVAR